jgi:hypothetical protein
VTEPLDGPARKSSDNRATAERTPEKMPSTSPKLSITSLALAIVALMVFCSVIGAWRVLAGVILIVGAVAGVILGVGAVVTGVVARRRVKRGDAGRGGVALAGIALGVAAVVGPAIFLAMMVYYMYSGYEEFQQCIRGSGFPKYLCLKECPEFLDHLCRQEIGW